MTHYHYKICYGPWCEKGFRTLQDAKGWARKHVNGPYEIHKYEPTILERFSW